MQKTLAEIAEIIDGRVIGDKDLLITGLNGIQDAQKGDLTFIADDKFIEFIDTTSASAFIVSKEFNIKGKPGILVDNASYSFGKLVSVVAGVDYVCFKGTHETAIISENVKIGQNVSIGPNTIIENDCIIGDDTIIYGNCYVGHKTSIGSNCLIYPNVTIREKAEIRNNVIIHSGAVIGSDGFGFIQIKGKHEKIPQIGTVLIEDDVEIGANVTVDRARFDKTIIGQGTKIDNLVQIAHNVIIGKNSIIVAQVGIAGSTKIGNNVILAGQVGVVGHVSIEDNAIAIGRAMITKSVPANTTVFGSPAKPEKEARKINACVQRLPQYIDMIKELKVKITELEAKVNNKDETKNNKE